MFIRTKSPTIWITVAGDEQAESGRRMEFRFELKVKRIRFSELQELFKGAADHDRTDFEAVRDLVLDWRGVGDEAGEPEPYSPEALRDLMDTIGGAPVVRALTAAMPRAKEKNS